ncbi:MAG: NAD(P) transhydrogenase subunit alpha [Gammaproteobacteria bacterium]|nr:NAD(P) transhydrogenase subunit alpha [Gammaproteobacteria bacterium]
MPVTIGVIRETAPGEARVAIVPEVAKKLAAAKARLVIEAGAAAEARFADTDFEGQAAIVADAAAVLAEAQVLLRVQPPTLAEAGALKPGSVVIGYLQPHLQKDLVRVFCERNITSFAMELVPRISRAQSMDALSSQAAVSGYKAVLLGAGALDKFLPMLTTAAGTIRPSQALIMGAGVAGLQAIATARRLGAVVEAFDVRAATKEQVESLGAKFVDTGVTADGAGGYARELSAEERQKQQAVVNDRVAKADLVITTAAVPGRPAPRLIDRTTVERMRPGAVIVDLGAESGGNCELTRAGETVVHRGVTIIGPVNLAATVPRHASEMYARNLFNFLSPALTREGELAIDWNDEVFAGAVLTHAGTIRHEPTRKAFT